jgi:photosystem II stability/assembly factor-like uncharacterized protein
MAGEWRQEGPYLGSVKALAFDPESPDTVYAGTYAGGVLKSVDGGETWRLTGAELINRVVTWVKVHPGRSGSVYAGVETRRGNGLWRSADGGESWQPMALPGLGRQVLGKRIAVAPSNPRVMLMPNVNILFRSTDGGETWGSLRVPGMDVVSVVFHPTDASIVYACGSEGSGPGFRYSDDGGLTWKVRGGRGLEEAPGGKRLEIDSVEPSTLYMVRYRGLFKSSDEGETWARLTGGLDADAEVYDIALDPTRSGTLLVAVRGGVFRSTDGGESWQDVDRGMGRYPVRAVAVHPVQGNLVMAGSSAHGVFKSSDGGGSWGSSSSGLAAGWVTMVAADPRSDGTLLAQTTVGLYRRDPAGRWQKVEEPFSEGKKRLRTGQVVFDAGSQGTILVPDQETLFRSDDRGATWNVQEIRSKRSMLNPLKAEPEFNSLAQDREDPDVLYAGIWSSLMKKPGQAIFRSSDHGERWVESGTGVPLEEITMLRAGKQGAVYAMTGSGGLYRSSDRGESWSAASSSLPFSEPRDLVVDPVRPGVLYVPTEKGLFRSDDKGSTWSNATEGLESNDVEAVAVGAEGRIFIGTFTGVLLSTDGGTTWEPFGEGLPNTDVRALALDQADPPRLYVGTAGGSVFSIQS